MGVWNDVMLRQACEDERLVDPYNPGCINPASIDLCLGGQYRRTHPFWDSYKNSALKDHAQFVEVPLWGEPVDLDIDEFFWLQPGEFVLCHSLETVNIPVRACAFLYSKSSTGRRGLEHLHAGYGDPGFIGQWTWEFQNVSPAPMKLVVGKPLMQMVLLDMAATPQFAYEITGRYMNQTGATPARN